MNDTIRIEKGTTDRQLVLKFKDYKSNHNLRKGLLFTHQLAERIRMVYTKVSNNHPCSLSKDLSYSLKYIDFFFLSHQNKHAHALTKRF